MSHKFSRAKAAGTIDVYLGRRLRELRDDRNLSQRALGKMIGVAFQQIQKYEHGKDRITVARFGDICRVFGVGFEFFLPPPASSKSSQWLLTAEEGALLAAFQKITSELKRSAFLRLVEEVADTP